MLIDLMRKICKGLLLLALLISASGCAQEAEKDSVIATINDEPVYLKDFNRELSIRIRQKPSFKMTEDSIEGIVETAGRIQNLSEKAAKGGMKIFDKQMDMFVSSLKTVRNKFTNERKRIKAVFSEN